MPTPVFAETLFNVHSLWFQIPCAIFCAYVAISCLNLRSALRSLKRPEGRALRVAPWSLGAALAMFLLFALGGPGLGTLVALPMKAYLSDYGDRVEIAADSDVQTELALESDPSTPKNDPNADPSDALDTGSTEKTPESLDDADDEEEDLATQHLVARMLIRAKSHPHFFWVFCLFILTVVISAPIAEELVFRVTIQGAFERFAIQRLIDVREESSDVQTSAVDPGVGTALLSIVPGAFFFAILHFSMPEDPNAPLNLAKLVYTTLIAFLGNLMTIALGFAFLRKRFDARAVDLGLGFLLEPRGQKLRRFLAEFARGAALFLISMPLVYLIQNILKTLLPGCVVDPAPIFVFALWEGFVYYRTHSYPTVVGMHVGLNFSSFLFLCFMLG